MYGFISGGTVKKLSAKKIISEAIEYWENTNKKKYRNIIFLETSSTKINNKQFGIKHKNKDWGYYNWKELINKLSKDYLVIQSIHNESKQNVNVF